MSFNVFETIAERLRQRNNGSIPFRDLILSIRNRLEGVLENQRMTNDILFMVTYMTAITTGQISRPEIFAYTASRKEYIPAKYIEKVEFFVKRWGYSYAEGLEIVAERTPNAMLRSMLNRYGNSIGSGVPDDDFLKLELSTVRSIYRNTFEQGFEMLKKWGDAYIALMLSASIVGIIIMVSVAIYSPNDVDSMFNISYFIVILIAIVGLVTMYRSIPEDQKSHRISGRASYEQGLIRRMEIILIPVAALSAIILFATGFNPGFIALMTSLFLAPMGIIGFVDDLNIIKRDEDFSTFIRGLGSIMGGKGLTTTFAMGEVDRKSLPVLGSFIDGAYTKLNLGLDDRLVWDRFIGDCGSNLIYKYLNIFRDSIALGGSPADIGTIVSSSLLEQVLLRKKREMISTGFIVLMVPMHMAMIAIFMFLYQILLSMTRGVTEMMASLGNTPGALETGAETVGGSMMNTAGLFMNFPEAKIGMFVAIMLFIITISNVFAGKIVKGGDRYMFYFFGSLLFALTGIIYIVTPFVVDIFFQLPVMESV